MPSDVKALLAKRRNPMEQTRDRKKTKKNQVKIFALYVLFFPSKKDIGKYLNGPK